MVEALPLIVAAGGFALYQLGPSGLAGLALAPYVTALVLAPSWVYPRRRARGASLPRAAAGASLVLVAWLAKESLRMSAVYPPAETAYYALNPLALGLAWSAALQIAAWEWRHRHWRGLRARGPALAVAALLAVAAAGWLALRESGGRELIYAYVALHGRLFGQ